MRILALRGSNLASLASAFGINLKAAPLNGAGLFAITGDTGAGKSTLLDAMCLALYGEYPRAISSAGEKLVDAGGKEMAASDPRNILRKGAAEGFAEVDFTGQDGIDYRAKWTVRRARKSAAGNLQAEERVLERLDGSGAVASGIKPTLAAVIAKTGLTYTQFRRTVLLAQGDFDAFLLANESERAALLEKLTGTEIYSRISVGVFEAAAERKRAVDDLVLRAGAVEVLDAAARAELDAKLMDARRVADEAKKGLAEVDARVVALERLISAQTAVDAAATALAEADRRRAGAGALMSSAALARKIAPLGELFMSLRTAEGEVARLKATRAATADAAETAKAELASADEQRRAAQGHLNAAKADIGRLEPLWRQASALDVQVLTAAAEYGTAQAEADEARRVLAAADAAVARLLQEQKDSIGATGAPPDELSRMLADKRAQRVRAVDERRALELKVAALDAKGLRVRAGLLSGLAEALRTTCDIADKAHGRVLELAQAETALHGAQSLQTQTVGDLATANVVLAEAALALKSATELGEMADLTLSAQAEMLRLRLVPGEACAVCGSHAHPIVQAGSAILEHARRLQDGRTAAKARYEAAAEAKQTAETAARVAAREVERTKGVRAQAERAKVIMTDALTEAFAALVPRLATADLNVAVMVPSAEALAGIGERLAAERTRVDLALAHVAQLDDAVAKRVSEIDALDTAIETLQELGKALEMRSAKTAEVVKADKALKMRSETLAELRSRRAALLDGQATDAHRAQHETARADAQKAADEAEAVWSERQTTHSDLQTKEAALSALVAASEKMARDNGARFAAQLAALGIDLVEATAMLTRPEGERRDILLQADAVEQAVTAARLTLTTRQEDLVRLLGGGALPTPEMIAEARAKQDMLKAERERAIAAVADLDSLIKRDREAQAKRLGFAAELDAAQATLAIWHEMREAIGSADGAKFRRFAQGVTLEHLVALANHQLQQLNPRYRLRRAQISDLNLEVIDRDMGDDVRSPRSLSGGERFLVSLALALALAGLEGRQAFVDTLFIDEGFGTLDRETLDVAIDALETLQGQGRQVGVITHVGAMIERIAVQVRVEKRGGGRSVVKVQNMLGAEDGMRDLN